MSDMNNDKPRRSIFSSLGRKSTEQTRSDNEKEPLELKPAMPELGTAPCPVCGHRVAVFVTRTKRPFINCGFCSARIFYNGSRSMELLKDQIKAPKKGGLLK
jgi:DNA-directed RNA polymerase subunit RPC12/RpoP